VAPKTWPNFGENRFLAFFEQINFFRRQTKTQAQFSTLAGRVREWQALFS
jgi:hypothetical protein